VGAESGSTATIIKEATRAETTAIIGTAAKEERGRLC